jgi:uncharacterized membrane protein
MDYPAMNARQVSLAAAFVAVGAVAQILLSNLALDSPTPLYGVLIKVGMSETLTIIFGLVYGAGAGFLTGFMLILVSDLFLAPGPWTPFIGGIIGTLGLIAGIMRRWIKSPTPRTLALLAIPLTILSEVLQNSYVTIFYGVPFSAAMITGLPSLITAVVNNVLLLGALGPRLIRVLLSV